MQRHNDTARLISLMSPPTPRVRAPVVPLLVVVSATITNFRPGDDTAEKPPAGLREFFFNLRVRKHDTHIWVYIHRRVVCYERQLLFEFRVIIDIYTRRVMYGTRPTSLAGSADYVLCAISYELNGFYCFKYTPNSMCYPPLLGWSMKIDNK